MKSGEKRVALITGGSRGIGFGIAKHLARDGLRVVINGRRPANDVSEVLGQLEQLGGEPLYCQSDIGELAEHEGMINEVEQKFGRLDVLVNNAGVAPEQRTDVMEATPESFDRLMKINLRGPYFLTQRVARWMVEQRQQNEQFQGSIINVSSISAAIASVNRGEYCISKAGVAMATQLWAMRLGEYGIPVYEVRPGIIKTDMTAGVSEKYDELLASGLTIDPRWGKPDDVGRAVSILASGALSYSTGAVIPVDGGLTVSRL